MTNPGAPAAVHGPVRREALEGGAVWRLVLATPKANVLDAAKITALTEAFRAVVGERGVKCVLIEGEGPHFSFGASVEEHLLGRFEAMLTAFHGLFRAMLAAAVPTAAVVRGQCLGGGLELASFCTRVFATPDAKLGQPEIKLGVVAPMASFWLPERIGRSAAEDLLLTGRSVGADEARALRLVDEVADDPTAAALAWARAHLAPLSASSLRHAQRLARAGVARRFDQELSCAERAYRDELMRSADANEGLKAFLEKRPAQWSDA
ncbi:MAG: enoyl-CoA hydratase/isomerase family protein [Planctomycetes bacterium]|nr:enoyl-CoA hydratase/isomerase family protein [Planctomycetota bacterium]